MTNFTEPYKKLLGFEGNYSNDKDDSGGETFKGISRVNNPQWGGWALIDSFKGKPDFLSVIKNHVGLNVLAQQFYKKEYWDKFDCDNLSDLLAFEIFEQAVNMGVGKVSRNLQVVCNILNRNQELYSDIVIDGQFGNGSRLTLKTCIQKNGEKRVFNVLNILQGGHYVDCMLKNGHNEKFIGWFDRIEIVK